MREYNDANIGHVMVCTAKDLGWRRRPLEFYSFVFDEDGEELGYYTLGEYYGDWDQCSGIVYWLRFFLHANKGNDGIYLGEFETIEDAQQSAKADAYERGYLLAE